MPKCANVLCDNIAEAGGLCNEHIPKHQRVSLFLQCSVNRDDHLRAYITTAERAGKADFVIVLTNAAEQKISTVLSRDDAIKLQNELNDFIINN